MVDFHHLFAFFFLKATRWPLDTIRAPWLPPSRPTCAKKNWKKDKFNIFVSFFSIFAFNSVTDGLHTLVPPLLLLQRPFDPPLPYSPLAQNATETFALVYFLHFFQLSTNIENRQMRLVQLPSLPFSPHSFKIQQQSMFFIPVLCLFIADVFSVTNRRNAIVGPRRSPTRLTRPKARE